MVMQVKGRGERKAIDALSSPLSCLPYMVRN